MQIEEMEEYKEYKKAYAELLQSVLNMRFFWMAKPEDFLSLILLAEQAATKGPVPEITPEEKAAGLVLPNREIIAAVFDEWLQIRYAPYKDLQDLLQNGVPSSAIFTSDEIRFAESVKGDFFVDQMIRDASGVERHRDAEGPHQITQLWAEAFVEKLSERIKMHDSDLCEIMLACNIHRGAFMAV